MTCSHDPRFSGVLGALNGCVACELEATQRKLAAARNGLQATVNAIDLNNDQNGFWGVASAHGMIYKKLLAALEASK